MSNEPEVIVDPINEEEEVETLPEAPPAAPTVEKPVETPEARAARLLRMTNQQRKRVGLPPVGESQPVAPQPAATIPGMDAMEVANLSVVFNGLDTSQRAKLIKEVKANGKEVNSATLEEAKKSEDYLLWNSSYEAKVAKEKAPTPETKMPGEGKPKSEMEILDEGRGTFEDFINPSPDKTKVLEKTGLWKHPQARSKNDTIRLSN